MVERLYKKGLVVGIIVLLVSMSGLTSVSSKDISISDDKIVEDNNENEPLDINKEIFTYVKGYCSYINKVGMGKSIYYDVEMYADVWGLTIMGIGFPFIIFINNVHYLKLPCLIGSIYSERYPYIIDGFAIGNIEWSR